MRAESGWLYSRASTPVGPLELHRSSLSRYLSHDEYTDPKPSELFMIRAGEMDGIIGDEDPTKRIAPVVDCQLLNGNMQVIRSTKHHRPPPEGYVEARHVPDTCDLPLKESRVGVLQSR
ncbi:hypothetical protein PCANC_08760 [Puccinia coronata f. sp. avenae]|uniref:Uncharacterized protein n=1 Tax=Puccinia coronata f. sp. avenae TaxID=200324 RepID=A0A2N5TBZ4_9BASI|nr:hypothetical protein PCANC_08760 [Puccinia coronata f. sp. avenae]PLW22992.1 hypothetical protein PCASD_14808 [Puccinia coronata f. sp. avenae]